MRQPCFDNLLAVLRREVPDRTTLFEFYLNEPLERHLTDGAVFDTADPSRDRLLRKIRAFERAGYDYVTLQADTFGFPKQDIDHQSSHSLNDGVMIEDEESFDAYPWPDPDTADLSRFPEAEEALPSGMRIIAHGPCGVLENVIRLTGYENLCYLIADEPDFVQQIFDAVGARLLRYYERVLEFDAVGAIIGNDDWGFKTQTMLGTEDMRRYVFPWHKRIVTAAHAAGKPAILHSCGYFDAIIDDVIDDMQYDCRHSYEDTIVPVEEAYERLQGRIAVLGGIDLDFMCRSTPKQIAARCRAMLERAADRGGYALGTGNSVPEYVPQENYLAMIDCVLEACPHNC